MSSIIIKFSLLSIVGVVCSEHLDTQGKITGTQKKIFQQFKLSMKPLLKPAFMKTDSYLLTTLRKNNFNPIAAKTMIKENLLWRRQNKMDTILSEHFEDMEEMFPFQLDSTDPLLPIEYPIVGKLDITQETLLHAIKSNHKIDMFTRYLAMLMEKLTHEVIKKQMHGYNTTQATILANSQTFSQRKQGCGTCQFAWMNLIHMAQSYYTGLIKEIIIFDAPPNAEKLADALDCLFSLPTTVKITIFGGKEAYRIGSNTKRNQFGCMQTTNLK